MAGWVLFGWVLGPAGGPVQLISQLAAPQLLASCLTPPILPHCPALTTVRVLPPLLPPAPAAYGNRLATGREPMLSGTVVGIAYLVGRLAGIFSLVGLAYGAALAAFTLPKVSQLWPLGPGPVQATPAPAAIAAAGVGGKLNLQWLWGLRPHLPQLICCCQNDVQRAVSGAAV